MIWGSSRWSPALWGADAIPKKGGVGGGGCGASLRHQHESKRTPSVETHNLKRKMKTTVAVFVTLFQIVTLATAATTIEVSHPPSLTYPRREPEYLRPFLSEEKWRDDPARLEDELQRQKCENQQSNSFLAGLGGTKGVGLGCRRLGYGRRLLGGEPRTVYYGPQDVLNALDLKIKQAELRLAQVDPSTPVGAAEKVHWGQEVRRLKNLKRETQVKLG